jgi:hypothetical protein
MDSAATSDGKPIVLFSFGYWGCGSATKELVAAVSSAEAQRGFAPPLWVDIRLQRSVRAAGFRDRAFERLLGANYQWLPSLGNMSVADGGSRIRIQEPAAANDLLDLGVTNPERRDPRTVPPSRGGQPRHRRRAQARVGRLRCRVAWRRTERDNPRCAGLNAEEAAEWSVLASGPSKHGAGNGNVPRVVD